MSYKKIKLFFIKKRRIQVYLTFIFIVLITVSSLIITRYTYTAYYKDIENVSLSMINQSSNLLIEKINSMKNEVQLVVEVVKGSIQTVAKVTGEDSDYIDFLVNILEKDPFFTAITIATPEGDYLSVINANFENISCFYSRPLESLPEEVKYIIRTIRKNGTGFEETWKYINQKGVVLAVEPIIPASHDFAKNPWVLKMIKDPQLTWNRELLPRGAEKFMTKRVYGVTLSDVVKDSSGNVFAILSVNVTLKNLSDFVLDQKITGNGSAFILDDDWNIQAPAGYGSTPEQALVKKIVEEAHKEYETNNQKDFSLIFEGKEYLFSFRKSIEVNDKWSILCLVPYSDLFGFITKTQNRTRLMSVFVIFIMGIAGYYSSRYFSRPVVQLARQVDKIRDFDFTETVPIKSLIKEIFDLESSIRAMRSALRSFGRYVPKEIVRALIKCGHDVHLGGERLEITILFSDVENFTTISESMSMETLMTILSDYFDVISKIVLEEEGTIDKYIGDSLMAFWGAPLKITDHAEKACLTSLQCLAAIKLQKKWVTRFGIHTGEVIVGNIGTSERINYTVIGDAVNVASRLEGINKEYHTSIMISEVVRDKLTFRFVTRPIDFVAVKGKKTKLKIFELMGMTDGILAATSEQIELSKLFTVAYAIFEDGMLEEAKRCFLEIEKKFPLDVPTKKYLERLK